MKKISDDELKVIEFNLLKEFRDVCDKLGINYSLIGGTLIGAIRHNGFIPWDDDVDVCMTRDEFIKFKDYCIKTELPFKLLCNETNSNYGYIFAKLYDPKTLIVEDVGNRKNIDQGVCIDIFIYDGMGNTFKESKKKFNRSRFNRELLIAANWKKYSRSKTRAWYYEPIRFVMYVLSRFVNYEKLIKKIEKNYIYNSFFDYKFVGNLASHKRDESIIERECFSEYVEVNFEGEKFKAIKGYDTYLKNMYGDYMKLPPENKRITHHTFTAFYKQED